MSAFGWFYLGTLCGIVSTTLSLTWFAARYLPAEAAAFAAAVVARLGRSGEGTG